ncbi:hypothetical protein CVS40_2799 [Lucilia cuprina]|nr:hypothetical protein CVS40_2799 [Lucilia cuprina]
MVVLEERNYASRENLYSSDQQQQQQQNHQFKQQQQLKQQQRQQPQHHSHQHLLRQSLINLTSAQNTQTQTAPLYSSHSDNNSYCSAVTTQEGATTSDQDQEQQYHHLQQQTTGDQNSGSLITFRPLRVISCTNRYRAVTPSDTLPAATSTTNTTSHTTSAKGASRNFYGLSTDNDNEFLLDSEVKPHREEKGSDFGKPSRLGGNANTTCPRSSTGDDHHSLQYETSSAGLRFSSVSKQNSYDSGSPQLLTLTDANQRYHQQQHSPTSRLSYSPNSKSSSLAIADDYQDSQQTQGDFKHLVVHNLSNSDPLSQTSSFSHHQLEDVNNCPLLKTHYSDCNIYAKNELDSQSQQPDKQQLVNKAYIFKCIGNSPSFLKTNKIKEQSRKLRNLSLKTHPTGKKKSQILAKSNAVSDNSLHPGDKYLNLYLVEKKQQQQQQQQQQSTSTSPSVASGHQVSRHSTPYIVNGAVKSSYPTYRSSIKSETAVSAVLAAAAAAAASANSSNSYLQKQQQVFGGKSSSVNYLSSNPTSSKQQQPHQQQYKTAKINNKGCNLVNNGNKLSVSTNSCNRLHAGSPHAISPKSSLSSNGHLNKYCLTDISRRKTEFNRQLSAPTDYTHHSSSNGSHQSTNEVVGGESTSTVASAGVKTPAYLQQHSLPNQQQQQQQNPQTQQTPHTTHYQPHYHQHHQHHHQQQQQLHQHQHPHHQQQLLQQQQHHYQHSQQHLPQHHSATVLTKPTSNSCTNSFNRRHIKRQKNTKLNERYVKFVGELASNNRIRDRMIDKFDKFQENANQIKAFVIECSINLKTRIYDRSLRHQVTALVNHRIPDLY